MRTAMCHVSVQCFLAVRGEKKGSRREKKTGEKKRKSIFPGVVLRSTHPSIGCHPSWQSHTAHPHHAKRHTHKNAQLSCNPHMPRRLICLLSGLAALLPSSLA